MKKRILIVDDMPETLVMLMAYLSSEGYEVVTAQNGIEALSLLGSNPPDVIISDIMMPKMGGFEFLDKMRRNYPSNHIPLIVMSAKNKNVAEQMALDLGAEGFLEKPVSLTVIKAAIEAALTKAKKQQKIPQISRSFVEQRQHKRAPFICEAYFEGGGISGLTVASNLSKGGLFLDTFSNIPPGTLLHLRLKLQPGREVEMLGEVRYRLNGGIGVEFINLDKETMEFINNTVEQVLSHQNNAASMAISYAR
ncbi:MAG: response regulator [Acidobacteriota bacterium]